MTMKFKKYYEALTINPLFLHPGETMDQAHKDAAELNKRYSSKEKKRKTKSVPVTIMCWRGFDESVLDRDMLNKNSTSVMISPYQNQERLLWFTNSLQQAGIELSESPIDYAKHYATKGHNVGYLLTYPLQATKHYDEVEYEDGNRRIEAPQELADKIRNLHTEASPYRNYHGAIYELPKGWVFTWQNEKHIGCQIDIKVDQKMLQKVTA